MGTALLPTTQGLLQEIPALQHFLHTPRGCETLLEKPDVVFRARPASAPVAQHSADQSARVPAGSGAEHPWAIAAQAEKQQR